MAKEYPLPLKSSFLTYLYIPIKWSERIQEVNKVREDVRMTKEKVNQFKDVINIMQQQLVMTMKHQHDNVSISTSMCLYIN